MQVVETPSGDAVVVMDAWELRIVTTGVAKFRSDLDVDSPFATAMMSTLEEAVKMLSAEPCICGDMHPVDDCLVDATG